MTRALIESFVLGVIVKGSEFDVCRPLETVIDAVPAVAIKLAFIDAVTCDELTSVVVSCVPFHEINAPETKLVPFTVSVKALLPAAIDDGDKLVIVGAGASIEKFRLNSGVLD